MGLDMYLESELFVGGQYEHREAQGECRFSIGGTRHGGIKREYEIPLNKISSITGQVGYWRKANAIHNWFVNNVQGGKDECQRSYVTREHLEELRRVCQEVLSDMDQAPDLLPPTAGFFFGSTDIDDWYKQDLQETVDIINNALAMPAEYDFYYQASW